MAQYLVRQRNSQVAALGGAMRSCAPSKRISQIAEVTALRSQVELETEFETVLKDYGARPNCFTKSAGVTGIHFITMEPEQAEKMTREQPDLLVLRDQPLELIRPQVSTVTAATNKPTLADLWHLAAIGLTPAVRKRLNATGAGVTIAVLDTGIDDSHPEIQGRVKKTVRFDVANKQVQEDPQSTDTHGHGTHVAGLIAGKQVGVAPGADLWNGIMIPGGRGMLSDFVLAMDWCAQQPEVQILNMSAGIAGWVKGMEDVVADLLRVGVLPVIATGNEGGNHTRSPGNYSEVLSVGASTAQNKVAPFSSGGRLNPDSHVWIVPDLVAPGANVMSCIMGGRYEAWDGTSMATPIVSGMAALLLERHGGDRYLLVSELQEMLQESCRDLGTIQERQGRGLLQVHPSLMSAPQSGTAKKAAKKATAKKTATKKATVVNAALKKAPPSRPATRVGKKALVKKPAAVPNKKSVVRKKARP